MADLNVVDVNNKEVGKVSFSEDVFGRPLRKDLLNSVVKWQRARRRQGTHMAKTRAMVRGTGAKPYKQKGTGNARRGSEKSPLIRGGGVIFGPSPRNYDYALPKKVRSAALKTALSYLMSEGKIKVVDSLVNDAKTKLLAQNLKTLGVTRTMIIDHETNTTLQRAAQNLPRVQYQEARGMNVYDLLKYDHVIFTKEGLQAVESRLQGGEA